jgi:hypothetical protein
MVNGWKEAMKAEWGQVLQILTTETQFLLANRSMLTSTKSYWDSIWSPGSWGCILIEQISSGRFSGCQHRQYYAAVLSRILYPSRLTTIFAGLEPAGLFFLEHLAGDSPGDTSCLSVNPTSIHHCRTGSASGQIHLLDLPLILPASGKPLLRKRSLHWLDGQPMAQQTSTSTYQGYHKLRQEMKT